MNSFLYYISILNAHLPFHRKWWGFMFWSLQHHLSTFIPFHPTVWTYWNYFRFLDANAPSLCFSPGLCRIAFPTFRTVSDVHLFTHSPQVWLRDHFQWFLFQKPFLDLSSLVWVLLPCAPIPQLTSVSLWWPVDVCVCVCDLFFLWEGSYKHQVWEPFSKMAAIESSLPSSACHSPMEQWSLFFPSPWIQIGFNDSLGPIKCSRSSSWNSKAFTWVS